MKVMQKLEGGAKKKKEALISNPETIFKQNLKSY